MGQKITIIHIRRPQDEDVNALLQWLGSSLGLFNERDKDSSCYRLFVELINCNRHNCPMTSDELAHRLHLTRATVVHHLHKLLDAGIVVRERNYYLLRDRKLKNMIEDVQTDLERMYDDLQRVADDIDRKLGL